MALTDVGVCKNALLRLGAEPITSFTEGTDRATTCAEIYPRLRDAVLTTHPWRFAIGKKQLAKLTSVPTNEWENAFQLPPQMLWGPWAVFNSTNTDEAPIRGYEIFEDKLYTDEDVIVADILVRPAESKWPPWFVELMVLATAAAIAPNVTRFPRLAEEYNERAWGTPSENFKGGWFRVCTERNAQIQPNQPLYDFSLINARFG